jgi:uncharacterized membrane protein YkvA (DUF1232 family)
VNWFRKKTSIFVNKIKLDSLTLLFATRHPETPYFVTVLLWLVVAYALSPIDLIPDFIPILGLLDDLIILALAVTFMVRMLPIRVVDRCRAYALQFLESKGKTPTIYFGIFLILFLWAFIAFSFYNIYFNVNS